jgi:hypothetical protein
MDLELLNLTKYVDAVAELAATLESDIKAGDKISSKTVLALSKLVAAARTVERSLSIVEHGKQKYN